MTERNDKIPKENCRIVENTHEPIIDIETFEIVQKARKGEHRRTSMGEMDKFSELVFCETCSKRHYFIRGTTLDEKMWGSFVELTGGTKSFVHRIRY